MNYIVKLITRSLTLHTCSKADFVLKTHFGISLGLATDTAVDGKKGSVVRLAPDTPKKSVLKQISFQKRVTGLLQSLPN